MALIACGQTPVTPTPTPTPPPAPTPNPSLTRFVVSGVVADDAGERLKDIFVTVRFSKGFAAPYYVSTRTDTAGEYSLTFDASERWYLRNQESDFAGLAFAWEDEPLRYEPSTEVLARGTSNIRRDFTLRRVRSVAAGDSTSISVDGDSGLCIDEDAYSELMWIEWRCEMVRVVASQTGTLTVEIRALDPGAPTPYFGLYETMTLVDKVVFKNARAGGVYRFRVGVPASGLPARYELTAK